MGVFNNDARSLNGDTGTQVNEGGALGSNVDAVLYTVTADKNFYLTNINLTTDSTTTGTKVEVRNGADAVQYPIIASHIENQSMTTVFVNPIKIAAGYDLYLTQPNDTSTSWTLHGWEEDA